MKCKQDFYNEPTDNLSKTPAFSPKSAHKPHEDHGCLEVFLISVESNESVVRKGSDKGSSVVVWDRDDYF